MKNTIKVTDEEFVNMITESVMGVLNEGGLSSLAKGFGKAAGGFLKGLNVGELAKGAKNAFQDATNAYPNYKNYFNNKSQTKSERDTEEKIRKTCKEKNIDPDEFMTAYNGETE